jgi:hypothetical protein
MQQIFSSVGTVLLAAIGAALGWIILEFVGRPVRQFFDLRREIRRQIIFLENLDSVGLAPADITPQVFDEYCKKLSKAATTLRDLGSQAIAFDQTEWLAARVVRLLGLMPMQAGRGLIGLANSLENSTETEAHRTIVHHSLRFDRMGEYDWKHSPE